MEFSRSLSSKRSSAAIELCPSGLTERQMLQLALEESKNAALAAAAGKSEDSSEEENSDSDSDDGSSAHGAKAGGGKARRAKSTKLKSRVQQTSDHKHGCSTPRKRAKVEVAEVRTATSSENSKASRSTQLRDLVGAGFGDQHALAQSCHAASMAADNRESDSLEHHSGSGDQHSMCRQPAHDSASPSIKAEATEGAGETETSPRKSSHKQSCGDMRGDRKSAVALKEEYPLKGAAAEDAKPPTGLKIRKKCNLASKRSSLGPQRPPALTIPSTDDKVVDAGSTDLEACRKGRTLGSKAPRSNGRSTCSKGSRWASPLSSPAGGAVRRLRSAVVEEMKHNIEGIEAFAWQPQTPARQRASSLSGACALLSKLSSHSSGSLLREGSQALTPSFSAGQLSEVSTPRGSSHLGTPKWLSPISEMGSSPLQMGSQPSFAGELPCPLQSSLSAELASGPDMSPASPITCPSEHTQAEFMTPRRPTATLEFPIAARDVSSTPTLLMPPAPPCFGLPAGCLPLKKLHSGKLHMSMKASTTPGQVHVDVGCLARQVSADLKARHDLETKRLEMSAEGDCNAGGARSDASAAAAAHGSRLGKALKAVQLGATVPLPKASFQDSCSRLLKPFVCAKDAPAWKAPPALRPSPSGGCLSISPHLAKQREQRNLQNTWDDLLARQALEASAAEHLSEWAKASLPAQPAAQA